MDCGLTPQILVNATLPGVQVPNEYIQNGTIILNVHDHAVKDLDMANDLISFSARFSGIAHGISVPMDAVIAIYARENGQGLFFEVPEDAEEGAQNDIEDIEVEQSQDPADGDDSPPPVRGKPKLKLV